MKLRIKEVCQMRNTTQKELAEKLGVSEVTLSRASNGNTSLPLLEKIANALDVELWELFTSSTDNSNFMALIKDGDSYYYALTLAELENIVEKLKKVED